MTLGRGPRRGRFALVAAVVSVLLLTSGCSAAASAPVAPNPALGWGFTHTARSVDDAPPAAREAARQALLRQPMPQGQAIMGWGASNPEPSPGRYDFASLDHRIAFIRASGGVPVITLCCAPDWMKGGEAGETDWSELETAPLREHFADFANLSAEVARRYPDVKHFLVWNEFKGFFDDQTKQWDAHAYTEMYNLVYEAVKGVDPANLVGGPYLDMGSPPESTSLPTSELSGSWGEVDPRTLAAFDVWLREKRGADFVVVDGTASTEVGGSDEFAALEKLSAVSRWVGSRTPLPLWWAEWYVEPQNSAWSPTHQTAVRAVAMMEMALGGTDTALYWNPDPAGDFGTVSLWTDPASPDGGRGTPFLDLLQNFARWFPPGSGVKEWPAPPGARTLTDGKTVLMVNTTDQAVSGTVDDRQITLAPYETRWVPNWDAGP